MQRLTRRCTWAHHTAFRAALKPRGDDTWGKCHCKGPTVSSYTPVAHSKLNSPYANNFECTNSRRRVHFQYPALCTANLLENRSNSVVHIIPLDNTYDDRHTWHVCGAFHLYSGTIPENKTSPTIKTFYCLIIKVQTSLVYCFRFKTTPELRPL